MIAHVQTENACSVLQEPGSFRFEILDDTMQLRFSATLPAYSCPCCTNSFPCSAVCLSVNLPVQGMEHMVAAGYLSTFYPFFPFLIGGFLLAPEEGPETLLAFFSPFSSDKDFVSRWTRMLISGIRCLTISLTSGMLERTHYCIQQLLLSFQQQTQRVYARLLPVSVYHTVSVPAKFHGLVPVYLVQY
jgi:hypothetical protein